MLNHRRTTPNHDDPLDRIQRHVLPPIGAGGKGAKDQRQATQRELLRILPRLLRDASHQPDRMESVVEMARAADLSRHVDRATCDLVREFPLRHGANKCRVQVLMDLKRYRDAKDVLDTYQEHRPWSPILHAYYGKNVYLMGDLDEGLGYVWDAVAEDPNNAEVLPIWLEMKMVQGGESGYFHGLESVAALPNSWRAALYLARHHLSQGVIHKATALYFDVINRIPPDSDGWTMIAGDLGYYGHPRAAINLLYSRFEPTVHPIETGLNLLQACVDAEAYGKGQRLLGRLMACGPDAIQPLLNQFVQPLGIEIPADIPDDPQPVAHTPELALV